MKSLQISFACLLFSLPTGLLAIDAGQKPAENLPISGDWNNTSGDGRDELGFYNRPTGSFVLCETRHAVGELTCRTFAVNTGLVASISTGRATPIIGRWRAGSLDTPGLYDPRTGRVDLYRFQYYGTCGFHCLASLVRTHSFVLGAGGDYPLAGDWDGNGIDSLALVHPNGGVTLFGDSNAIPTDFITTEFTLDDWTPIASRWPGNGGSGDSLAFFEPTTGSFVPFDGLQQQSPVTLQTLAPDALPVAGATGNTSENTSDLLGVYFPKVPLPACRALVPCHEVMWFPEDLHALYSTTGSTTGTVIRGTLNARFPNDPSG